MRTLAVPRPGREASAASVTTLGEMKRLIALISPRRL